jgi:tRNA A-37 threonylcarbamoyl transferase component Bud32
VYADQQRLSWPATLRIAQGIAAATQHLHTQGILHGDLYAHNILHTSDGDALLSDFGAAAFFDVRNEALAQGLEKLEVRALGCLLEELALQCDSTPHESTKRQALAMLSQQCMGEKPNMRPSLSQILSTLAAFNT